MFRGGERFRSLYVVKTGSVKTYAPSEEGGEQVLGFHLPGEIIGLDAIDKSCHACSAKVLETSAICEIPFDGIEPLSRDIPSLQRHLFQLMSRTISDDQQLILLLSKKTAEERIASLVREQFDLRPYSILRMLDLVRPIYRKTAAYGHFGREEPEFTWERTDRAEALRAAAGL